MKNRKTSHAFSITAFTLTIAALLVFAPMHVVAKDKGNKNGGGFGLDRAMERANPKAQDKLKRNHGDLANLHSFGRRVRSQARSSATAARY
jgi:hypothetical protein